MKSLFLGCFIRVFCSGFISSSIHAKHVLNNTQVVQKVSDLDWTTISQPIGISLKGIPFHAHFEDDKQGMSDSKITLTDQGESVESLKRVFLAVWVQHLSTKWTKWAWCGTLLMCVITLPL